MSRPRWTLYLEAFWWRTLMEIGMILHRLASPRPISPSFARTIRATVSRRPGNIGLVFYTPEDYRLRRSRGWRFPVVINFHGGGFTLGAATDDARWASQVVKEVDAVVVSVDYRLAPEEPFPTAVEDGVDATLFIAKHADELGLDAHCIIMSGFSAGGNLAFTVPLRLEDELRRLESATEDHSDAESLQEPKKDGAVHSFNPRTDFKIVAIVAVYPSTDYTIPGPIRRATCTRPSQTLPAFFVELFDACYIYPADCDISSPFLSPSVASDDMLNCLPDEIILLTCEWDMLRAEAERFGARLKRMLGKNVRHTLVLEAAHAWDKSPNPFSSNGSVVRHYREACSELKRIIKDI